MRKWVGELEREMKEIENWERKVWKTKIEVKQPRKAFKIISINLRQEQEWFRTLMTRTSRGLDLIRRKVVSPLKAKLKIKKEIPVPFPASLLRFFFPKKKNLWMMSSFWHALFQRLFPPLSCSHLSPSSSRCLHFQNVTLWLSSVFFYNSIDKFWTGSCLKLKMKKNNLGRDDIFELGPAPLVRKIADCLSSPLLTFQSCKISRTRERDLQDPVQVTQSWSSIKFKIHNEISKRKVLTMMSSRTKATLSSSLLFVVMMALMTMTKVMGQQQASKNREMKSEAIVPLRSHSIVSRQEKRERAAGWSRDQRCEDAGRWMRQLTRFPRNEFLINYKPSCPLKLTLGLDLFSTLVSNPDREFKKESLNQKYPSILSDFYLQYMSFSPFCYSIISFISLCGFKVSQVFAYHPLSTAKSWAINWPSPIYISILYPSTSIASQ